MLDLFKGWLYPNKMRTHQASYWRACVPWHVDYNPIPFFPTQGSLRFLVSPRIRVTSQHVQFDSNFESVVSSSGEIESPCRIEKCLLLSNICCWHAWLIDRWLDYFSTAWLLFDCLNVRVIASWNDWLINWSTDWLTDWLFDWLSDWLNELINY